MQPGDVVKKVLVELPGDLLGDHGHRPEVIAGPTARVVVRWLVGLLFVGLLFGLVGWSFTTSPELTSSIQVARFYQPTLDQLQTWEQKNETFQCEYSRWCQSSSAQSPASSQAMYAFSSS
jgi:hypothetical protein